MGFSKSGKAEVKVDVVAATNAMVPGVKIDSAGIERPVREIRPRRFTRLDLESQGVWLLGRLRERFTHLFDKSLVTQLFGFMDSNSYLLLRTDNACGLFGLMALPFGGGQVVDELFVLVRDTDSAWDREEAQAIYAAARVWAKSLSAIEVRVENFTDLERAEIVAAAGRINNRASAFIKVD